MAKLNKNVPQRPRTNNDRDHIDQIQSTNKSFEDKNRKGFVQKW